MTRGAHILVRLSVCVICLAGLAPALAPALELGPIEARSAQYEPLDARIPVRDARSGDLDGLTVVLGSPAQFDLAGVARGGHLGLLEFAVVAGSEGEGYIHVRTDEPVVEPSLTFLIEVDWPRGRTVRGYKVHLVAAAGSATGSPTPRAEPAALSEADPPPAPSVPAPSVLAPTSSGTGYGPVRKSDTLWSIASRLRPDPSVSTQRMMLAILEANPEAFAIMNVNALRAGTTLRIPGREEIGPDEPDAAIAEVQRQHSAWLEHRRSTAVRAAPAAADSGAESGGRIEVVSPEAATGTTGREDGGEVSALRRELALAMEETDAVRRENDELRHRLADVEDRIGELSRLVELKDEEIATLRAELSARPESMPARESEPGEAERIGELNRLVERKNREIVALRAELKASSATTPAPESSEGEPAPLPAAAGVEPATTPERESKSLPFGLGALPVNPVFLVGGAGLLLLLLGVLALLRRRASSAAEEDVLQAAEASPSEEDDLLVELEAVAAELSEKRGGAPDRRPDHRSRSVPAAVPDGGPETELRAGGVAGSGSRVEERIAELWRDEDDRTPQRAFPARIDAEGDSGEITDSGTDTFDIDALAAADSAGDTKEDDPGGELDIADTATEREPEGSEAGASRTEGDSGGGPERVAGTAAAGKPGEAPAAAAGEATGRDPGALGDPGTPDDGRQDTKLASIDESSSADADPDAFEAPDEDVGRHAGSPAGERPGLERESNDAGGPGPPARSLPDESTGGGAIGALPLEDVGEDEVRTKIDLAQVYMEMGDAESARGLLDAVLAEGDAEQRDTAREMLSRLA